MTQGVLRHSFLGFSEVAVLYHFLIENVSNQMHGVSSGGSWILLGGFYVDLGCISGGPWKDLVVDVWWILEWVLGASWILVGSWGGSSVDPGCLVDP